MCASACACATMWAMACLEEVGTAAAAAAAGSMALCLTRGKELGALRFELPAPMVDSAAGPPGLSP